MKHLKKTFRLWWKKPRPVSEREENRTVSFLELFYDLAYVVIIAELTHGLVYDFSMAGVVGYVCLFSLVWIAWLNGSYYHELHGNRDVRTRVFTFLQMLALVGMAIFAHNALGKGAQGFALSYTAFLVVVTFLWWRTGVHDPEHQPMSEPYTNGSILTTMVFAVSAFAEPPLNFYLWGGAVIFSTWLPVALNRFQNVDPEHREKSQRIHKSIVERFGLLTIIVLGEVIVGVVHGVNGLDMLRWQALIAVICGLFIAIAMWWIYFDFVSHKLPIQRTYTRFAWIYLHLPVTMGIAFVGAAIQVLLAGDLGVLPAAERWLLVIPVGVFLLSVTLLTKVVQTSPGFKKINKVGSVVTTVLGAAVLLLGVFELPALVLLGLVSLLLAVPVVLVFLMWTKYLYEQQKA